MSGKSATKILRKVLPWVIALGLMGYLFYKIPLDNLQLELQQINWPFLLLVVVFVDIGSWLTDSWATSRVFTWFLAPVGYLEFLPVRAATYLMAILNYNLGQAGMVYYVHRTKKAPLADVTGIASAVRCQAMQTVARGIVDPVVCLLERPRAGGARCG